MLQTETSKSRKDMFDAYKVKTSKYLINKELEWLIEEGNIRESVYFKGACGDRYTIYIATKRNKNVIDIGTVFNSHSYGTEMGNHIGTLRGYVLEMHEKSRHWARNTSYYGLGYSFKQLMRQGVMSKKNQWTIRYCRSAYFCKLDNNAVTQKGGTVEFTPWQGMKINIKTGLLENKPNRDSIRAYNNAKNQDTAQRKRNYVSNKNNREALVRYRAAGGDTSQARQWNATPGEGVENINWDMIPMNDIFKHRNVTLRTNILNHYGINKVLKTLKYDVVDVDFLNGGEYKLLNVTIPDLAGNSRQTERKGLYLEMINPSTGESHFEGVANVDTWSGLKKATVKEALAWRDGDRETQNLTGYEHRDTKSTYVVPVKLT